MASVAGADQDLDRGVSSVSLGDTVSPRYPDRPIRPLPKRRLRARLSEEQADSIDWPLVVSTSSPPFGSPSGQGGPLSYANFPHSDEHHTLDSHGHGIHSEHFCDCGGDHYRSEFESEEEEVAPLKSTTLMNGVSKFGHHEGRPSHHSPSSSADGYESFENTNNKKKRKIPVAGMGLSNSKDASKDDGSGSATEVFQPYEGEGPLPRHHDYSSSAGASGIGISGAGRGRQAKITGRSSDARRPLTASSNAGNAGVIDSNGQPNQGIIGNALSRAATKSNPLKGQENLSLLQRQQPGPSNGEGFTFQCPSDSAGKMSLPHRPNPAATASAAASRPVATQGTQTALTAGSPAVGHRAGSPATLPSNQAPAPPSQPDSQSAEPANQSRPRRPGRQLAIQARQRRMQQDYNNYHNPPKREDVWICEFCEYESLFGVPPVALIRQYEAKDLKERKIAEERRRLLEKAKAKSRKNKKSAKSGNKNSGGAAAHNASSNHHYDSQYDTPSPQHPDDPGEYTEDDDLDRVSVQGNVGGYGNAEYDPHVMPSPPPSTGHPMPNGPPPIR